MRSRINRIYKQNKIAIASAKPEKTFCESQSGLRLTTQLTTAKLDTIRIIHILFSVILVIMLIRCDQTPTSLDNEPYLSESTNTTFSGAITAFEFDALSWNFFFSVSAQSPADSIEVTAELLISNKTMAGFTLNDGGLGDDVQVNDGTFDQNWSLPDSLASSIDSLWTLNVTLRSANEIIQKNQTLQPEKPITPIISNVSHLDTLTLPTGNTLLIDTLVVTLTHPGGRDEIRDVSLLSLKPDDTYANNGNPIILYDDGGSVVFYSYGGIDFTSGDKTAGDNIYSLLLPLASSDLTGTYYWTFNARTWLGIEADPVEDSLVVLPETMLLKPQTETLTRMGVFQ